MHDNDKKYTKDSLYVPINEESIHSISVGCRAKDAEIEKLIEYCNNKLPGISIYKVLPTDNQYALRKVLIYQ